MAASSAEGPLGSASTAQSEAEFVAFDRFPWSKHKAFLFGLVETLGGPDALATPDNIHEGSTAFCRTVFFRRQTNRRIDLTQYNAFRGSHPAYPSIDRRLLVALYAAAKEIPEETTNGVNGENGVDNQAAAAAAALSPPSMTRGRRIIEAVAAGPLINPFDGTPTPPLSTPEDENVPSWQKSAPKNELRIAKEAMSADGAAGSGTGEAPYSDKFAKVVEAIQTGKELEGIRHIPDTVVRQPGITPMGKLRAPRKPWETAASANAVSPLAALGEAAPGQPDATSTSLIDLEFPPPPPPTEKKEEKRDGDSETKPDEGASAT